MRFERLLFIIPNLEGFYKIDYPHPGLGYLVEFLEQHGYRCDIMDMNIGYKFRDVEAKIYGFKPDIVGITLFSLNYKLSYCIADKVKKKFKLPVILGGPHISIARSEILSHTTADFAIHGEGEYPLLALCRGDEYNTINGLIYREDGEIRENPRGSFIQQMDVLPWPKYSCFEPGKYVSTRAKQNVNIMSSRGCPYGCIFCSVGMNMGRTFRPRSADNVIEEIHYWYKQGCRSFNFIDDNFAQDISRVYQICDLIEEQGWNNVEFNCSQGIRADKMERDVLVRMKEIGFRRISMGVESVNEKTLKFIKKGEKFNTIEDAVKTACELGFNVVLFFIVGLPTDSADDVRRSFRFALKYPIMHADFHNVVPYPKTELYELYNKNGNLLFPPSEYLNYHSTRTLTYIVKPPLMTMEEFNKVYQEGKRVTRLIEKRYMQGRLQEFGPLAKFLAWVWANRLVFNAIAFMRSREWGNKAISFLSRRFVPY